MFKARIQATDTKEKTKQIKQNTKFRSNSTKIPQRRKIQRHSHNRTQCRSKRKQEKLETKPEIVKIK